LTTYHDKKSVFIVFFRQVGDGAEESLEQNTTSEIRASTGKRGYHT
jgi:hypothetical protein